MGRERKAFSQLMPLNQREIGKVLSSEEATRTKLGSFSVPYASVAIVELEQGLGLPRV